MPETRPPRTRAAARPRDRGAPLDPPRRTRCARAPDRVSACRWRSAGGRRLPAAAACVSPRRAPHVAADPASRVARARDRAAALAVDTDLASRQRSLCKVLVCCRRTRSPRSPRAPTSLLLRRRPAFKKISRFGAMPGHKLPSANQRPADCSTRVRLVSSSRIGLTSAMVPPHERRRERGRQTHAPHRETPSFRDTALVRMPTGPADLPRATRRPRPTGPAPADR